MTAKEYARTMREELHRQKNQAVEDYKNEVIKELKDAKFPITDLKQGVKVGGIQQTDDAVLYERVLDILEFTVNRQKGD